MQMTKYQEYYVYTHQDPNSDEVVYVGHGKGSRAWHFGKTNRGEDHHLWALLLFEQGFLPHEFTVIENRGLTKSDACIIEQQMIRELRPAFNKPMGLHCLKFTPELQEAARDLRVQGLSYAKIADELGLSTMTIYRGLTGGTHNVK